MSIIGLVGFMGSGKGVVGEIITEHGYTKDSFAAPLKDATSMIFGWSRELVEGDTAVSRAWREVPDTFWSEKMGYPFTPRLALQLMGTEAGRDVFHKDIWVISLLNRSKDKNVVITDVRFRNEIRGIKDNGGILVRVKRGPEPFWFYDLSQIHDDPTRFEYMKQFDVHPSEWDWVGAEFDHTIVNDGELNDLTRKAQAVLSSM